MAERLLEVVGLGKRFAEVPALAGLDLEVAAGEILGLVGPDGAGKTTAMRLIAGLVTPDAGAVRVLGRDLGAERDAVRAAVGYMPQHYSLYGDLSVQENLRFFAGLYGVAKDVMLERERRLLGIARLEEFRARRASALSGGMYKKLALACALVHAPRLLLLDEPTNGVDPISRRELWALLDELLADGVGVLVSTPYMDEAARCHRVGMLVEGRLVACDTPAALQRGFGGAVWALETRPWAADVAALSRLPGVEQAYTVGRRVHLVTGGGAVEPAALAALGLEVVVLERVAPSFEDIFMSVAERRAGAAG